MIGLDARGYARGFGEQVGEGRLGFGEGWGKAFGEVHYYGSTGSGSWQQHAQCLLVGV